jgi:hypothetical protein
VQNGHGIDMVPVAMACGRRRNWPTKMSRSLIALGVHYAITSLVFSNGCGRVDFSNVVMPDGRVVTRTIEHLRM